MGKEIKYIYTHTTIITTNFTYLIRSYQELYYIPRLFIFLTQAALPPFSGLTNLNFPALSYTSQYYSTHKKKWIFHTN